MKAQLGLFGEEDQSSPAEKLWERVLEDLRLRISADAFEIWFAKTRGAYLLAGTLTVECEAPHVADWSQQFYSFRVLEVLEALEAVLGPGPHSVRFVARGKATA